MVGVSTAHDVPSAPNMPLIYARMRGGEDTRKERRLYKEAVYSYTSGILLVYIKEYICLVYISGT